MSDTTLHDRQVFDGDQIRPPDGRIGAPHWRELSRPVRNALSRLLGGGTLRSVAPETVRELNRLGLIAGGDRFAQLSPAGWQLLSGSRTWLKSSPTGADRAVLNRVAQLAD